MKLAMFTTKESYVRWLKNEIEAIRKHGLRQAIEEYESALKGETKERWMRFNNIPLENEEAWNQHLNWLRGTVEDIEKKIKKYEREIIKNS